MPPGVELADPDQEVVLNEALNIVAQRYEMVGEIYMLKELLAGGELALVICQAERPTGLAHPGRRVRGSAPGVRPSG